MAISKTVLKKDILTFLRRNVTAVIATSYKNIPYASTVYFICDDKLNFYFATKRGTMKYLNLAINKTVAIVVGFGPKHVSVQAIGNATILYKKQKDEAIDLIEKMQRERGITIVPINELEALRKEGSISSMRVVFRISPKHMQFLNLDDESLPKTLAKHIHKLPIK